ncbi:MAG: signal peptidase II [Patescibacteria group bacterium]
MNFNWFAPKYKKAVFVFGLGGSVIGDWYLRLLVKSGGAFDSSWLTPHQNIGGIGDQPWSIPILISLGVVVLVMTIGVGVKEYQHSHWMKAGGMRAGGMRAGWWFLLAVGVASNTAERIGWGAVTDYWWLPTGAIINLADVQIIVGGMGIIWYSLMVRK